MNNNIQLNKKSAILKSIIGITLLFGAQAWAETEASFNTWQNKLAPLYLWGVSMSGEMTSGPVSAPLEVDFSDAVSDLEGIFTLHYEDANGNWGIIAGYSFLNLGPSGSVPGTPISLDVDMKNAIGELAGMYRFGADSPWQLLADIRSYKLDATINGLPKKVTIDETLNDIFVGARYVQSINDK
jgi:hypothetical protein